MRLILVIEQAGFKPPEDTYFTWNSSFSWKTSQTNAVDKMFLMSFKSFVNTGNRRLMKKVLIARKLAIEPRQEKTCFVHMRKNKGADQLRGYTEPCGFATCIVHSLHFLNISKAYMQGPGCVTIKTQHK